MSSISMQYGERLFDYYGVRFPDSFLGFLAFLDDLGVQDSIAFLSTIGLSAAGPIEHKSRFNRFIQHNGLTLNDGRSEGPESDTGLSIIESEDRNPQAIELLLQGRSLWYWSDDQPDRDRLQQSYDRLKQAYKLMNRPALVEILNLYFQQRLSYLSQSI